MTDLSGLSGRDVRAAHRALAHASDEVLTAQKEQWDNAVSNLVHLLGHDPVLRTLGQDLGESLIDARAWWEALQKGPTTAQGTPHEVRFPPTLQERAALAVQLLRAVSRRELNWHSLPFTLYGAIGDYPARLRRAHRDLVAPLVKYLEAPLVDQMEQVRLEQQRPLVVGGDYFNNSGVISQSAVALGGSTASIGVGEISRADLAERFRQWSLSLPGVEEAQRSQVQTALQLLASVLEAKDDAPPADRMDVALAVQTVATASPTLREGLRQVAIGASANALGTMIPAAIQFVLGIAGSAPSPPM